MIIRCLFCQNDFEILDAEPDINKQLVCPHCGTAFEVTWLYPFTMDFVEETPLDANYPIESPINSN